MGAWIHYLGFALFVLASVGIASSTVFLVLALIGAAKFHREAGEQKLVAAETKTLPPVSLLKPVHGAEPHLRENVESFFVQDYPANYEIIFAADEENDDRDGRTSPDRNRSLNSMTDTSIAV